VVVSSVILVVSAIGGARAVVVATHTHTLDRRRIHAPLDHGWGARGKRAVVIGEYLRLVVKQPRLAPKDVGIEGIVVPSLLQTALYE
jgi:hypothetical protein